MIENGTAIEHSRRILKYAFVALTLGSIFLWPAASAYRAYQRREAITCIRAVAGPEIACGLAASTFEEQRLVLEPGGPPWLRRLMSEESCRTWIDREVSVDLSWSSATDADVLHLRYLTELRRLDLTGTRISDSSLSILRALPALEVLRLGTSDVTNTGLANLAALTRLRSLELDGVTITRDGLATLCELPRLVELHVRSNRLNDEGLEVIARMEQLEILGLSSQAITDTGLRAVKQMPRLRKLHLGSVPGLTTEGLIELKAARPALSYVW